MSVLSTAPTARAAGVGASTFTGGSMDTRHAYRATSSDGHPRGPWRATYAEAHADCPASGIVRQVTADELLALPRIPWMVVDVVFASGHSDRPDGIDVVWASALVDGDERLITRAGWALAWRLRK